MLTPRSPLATQSVHVLEHLMFKGAREFHKGSKKGDIWHALGDAGAQQINASTSKRRTEYHSQMPVRLLKTAIQIEADRMENPLLEKKGADGERIVVLNEYQRQRNSRTSLLRQRTFMASFANGSTGKAVIGTSKTIRRITGHMDELRQFQHKYYVPANACIVICGGPFDAEETLAEIHRCFGRMEPGECSRSAPGCGSLEEDEPQHGACAVNISGSMPVGVLGFRTGKVGNSREAIALEVLCSWFNMGVAGPFADMLKDPELHEVQGDYERTFGPTLFNVWVIPNSGGDTTEKTERLLMAVLERLLGTATSDFGMSPRQLSDLKRSMHRKWESQIDTCEGFNAQIVESLSRTNSPFDTMKRHEVLSSLTLDDISRTAHSVFVTHRVTVGKILPSLLNVASAHPSVSEYSVKGGAPTPCTAAPVRRFPFEDAVVTPSGVYVQDNTAPTISIRIHIPTSTASDAEAELRAALATAGVKLDTGEIMQEKDLHEMFHACGASASVDGSHAGLNLALEVPVHEEAKFQQLLSILKAGLTNPTISASDYTNKQNYLSEAVVGLDYDVNDSARRLFSRCIFHEAGDPRRLKTGIEEGAGIRSATRESALEGLRQTGRRGAFVTAVAPTMAHLRAVRQTFEEEGRPKAASDVVTPTPTVSPMAGRVVLKAMPGKTSATMLYGCAVPVGPKHRLSLPLNLALSALGSGFSSRLMQTVRDTRHLSYGCSSSTKLSDPGTTVVCVAGTFGEDLVEEGVQCVKDVVQRWKESELITQEELDIAKRRALGSVELSWNSPSMCADALHSCRVHFDQPAIVPRMLSLPDRINAVTLEECHEAVTQLLPPTQDWCCVVAGAIPETHSL